MAMTYSSMLRATDCYSSCIIHSGARACVCATSIIQQVPHNRFPVGHVPFSQSLCTRIAFRSGRGTSRKSADGPLNPVPCEPFSGAVTGQRKAAFDRPDGFPRYNHVETPSQHRFAPLPAVPAHPGTPASPPRPQDPGSAPQPVLAPSYLTPECF